MSKTDTRRILFDGAWQDADDLLITAESRGLWYGDGCFETFRSYSGKFLRLDDHMERLAGGMEYLGILSFPDYAALKSGEPFRRLLEENGFLETDCVIRLQVWREGGRGFNPPKSHTAHYAVSALPLPGISSSIRLVVVPARRIPAQSVNASFKLSNSINYIRASSEAAKQQADDALMLTTDDFIAETPVANIFWYRDGKVCTPSPDCDILPGITRSILIELLREEMDRPVEEGQFTTDDLMKAEAVWVCNSVRELVQVGSVNGHSFTIEHPVFNRLVSLFKTYKERSII